MYYVKIIVQNIRILRNIVFQIFFPDFPQIEQENLIHKNYMNLHLIRSFSFSNCALYKACVFLFRITVYLCMYGTQ